jgi:hypothetical protein
VKSFIVNRAVEMCGIAVFASYVLLWMLVPAVLVAPAIVATHYGWMWLGLYAAVPFCLALLLGAWEYLGTWLR